MLYEDFMSYSKGIYTKESGTKEGGHAVQLIGWGTEGKQDYWILENSWGKSWGEGLDSKGEFFSCMKDGGSDCGYFRIARGDIDTHNAGVQPEFVCKGYFAAPCSAADSTCKADAACTSVSVEGAASGAVQKEDDEMCVQTFQFQTSHASGGLLAAESFSSAKHANVGAVTRTYTRSPCPANGCTEMWHSLQIKVKSAAEKYSVSFYPMDVNGQGNGDPFSFDFEINCYGAAKVSTLAENNEITSTLLIALGSAGSLAALVFLYWAYHRDGGKEILQMRIGRRALAKIAKRTDSAMRVKLVRCNGLANADVLVGDVSDPYCLLYFNGHLVYKTAVVWDDLDPVFNKIFGWPGAEGKLRVEVYDYDYFDSDDFLGQIELNSAGLVALSEEGSTYDLGPSSLPHHDNKLVQGTITIAQDFTKKKESGKEREPKA